MRILYVTGLIVVVDQISKLLVKGFSIPFLNYYHQGMLYGSSIPVFGDVLQITYIENAGMAFGIDLGGKMYLTLFSLIASLGILYYLYRIRSDKFLVRLPLACILGGAIGNLIDRMFYGVLYGGGEFLHGKVVDFIQVEFFDINLFGYSMTHFPVFNVADSFVTIGVVLLLFFHEPHLETPSEPAPASEPAAPAEAAAAPGEQGPAASPDRTDA